MAKRTKNISNASKIHSFKINPYFAGNQCFSALKRIKTYLKNSFSQKRLNHIMLLNIFEEETEKLNLVEVTNDFSCGCECVSTENPFT